MDHFSSPRNSGAMDSPDVVGYVGTPGRGPYFIITLKFSGGVISEAKFQTYGCGAAIAAGSVLTELIWHRSVIECMTLTTEDVIEALEGVPPNKLHGPALAIQALQQALKDIAVAD